MKLISTTLIGAALALLGCGDAPVAGTAVAGLPAAFTGPGVYTVPAVPAVPFALASVRIEQDDGTVSVYYDLPAQLVGQLDRVELTGTPDSSGTVHLTGDAGTSTCTVSAAVFRCDEQLFGVHVDEAEASSGLPANDPTLAAVKAFNADPIGVLAVVLPSGM